MDKNLYAHSSGVKYLVLRDLLYYNFRFMSPCIINVGEERTNGWHK